ncbi:18439_t:CDS:1 [Funneliformis geosporum]|uniref:18439_t:CDS:1 n=1 Tax=Funneliformis geosporum TaxID=1117311 RepID=A0A9W4SGJ8_9GLOM|nr:18439_t:CDS:1 [Funneliformis geosporum]
MTEIKIPFTKTKFSHIPASKLRPGTLGIELEISTNFLVYDLAGSFERAVPPADSKVPFEKIAFIFADNNTETAFYQTLCDDNQKQFELSFDKDKIFLNVEGFANIIDKTKPEVRVSFKNLLIFFESKFSGIIKLTTASRGPDEPDIPSNILQIRNKAITAIKQALNSEPKLSSKDLSSAYQN